MDELPCIFTDSCRVQAIVDIGPVQIAGGPVCPVFENCQRPILLPFLHPVAPQPHRRRDTDRDSGAPMRFQAIGKIIYDRWSGEVFSCRVQSCQKLKFCVPAAVTVDGPDFLHQSMIQTSFVKGNCRRKPVIKLFLFKKQFYDWLAISTV